MWNFKGNLWNSTQNILPMLWKIWFLYNIEILRALRFENSYVFLKRPPVHPQVPDLQISYCDLTKWVGTSLVTPVMTTRASFHIRPEWCYTVWSPIYIITLVNFCLIHFTWKGHTLVRYCGEFTPKCLAYFSKLIKDCQVCSFPNQTNDL